MINCFDAATFFKEILNQTFPSNLQDCWQNAISALWTTPPRSNFSQSFCDRCKAHFKVVVDVHFWKRENRCMFQVRTCMLMSQQKLFWSFTKLHLAHTNCLCKLAFVHVIVHANFHLYVQLYLQTERQKKLGGLTSLAPSLNNFRQ